VNNVSSSWGVGATSPQVILDFTSVANWSTVKANVATNTTNNQYIVNAPTTSILYAKTILGSVVVLSGFN